VHTHAVLRFRLVASAALAFTFGTSAAVPSLASASQKSTALGLMGSSQPIESAGCAHSQPADSSPSVLSVRIVHIAMGEVALVGVCIEGAGPFPFLIDSGSSISVVDTQLSRRFHLRQVAVPQQAAGIGCQATVVPEDVSSWSVGGLDLKPQVVVSASLPNIAKSQPLAGVIGSDVLSRFGSIRIDYRTQTMSLGEPESTSPTSDNVLQGPTLTPTPARFLKNVRVTAELTILVRNGMVETLAPIRFDGSGAQLFVVDTGAAVSAVSRLLARSLRLMAAQHSVSVSGFGCRVTLAEVRSGRWTLGSASLAPRLIAMLPASGVKVDGLVGSDVLSRFGAVVIDYRGAPMLLESG
jgi:hypothetical protein